MGFFLMNSFHLSGPGPAPLVSFGSHLLGGGLRYPNMVPDCQVLLEYLRKLGDIVKAVIFCTLLCTPCSIASLACSTSGQSLETFVLSFKRVKDEVSHDPGDLERSFRLSLCWILFYIWFQVMVSIFLVPSFLGFC